MRLAEVARSSPIDQCVSCLPSGLHDACYEASLKSYCLLIKMMKLVLSVCCFDSLLSFNCSFCCLFCLSWALEKAEMLPACLGQRRVGMTSSK